MTYSPSLRPMLAVPNASKEESEPGRPSHSFMFQIRNSVPLNEIARQRRHARRCLPMLSYLFEGESQGDQPWLAECATSERHSEWRRVDYRSRRWRKPSGDYDARITSLGRRRGTAVLWE